MSKKAPEKKVSEKNTTADSGEKALFENVKLLKKRLSKEEQGSNFSALFAELRRLRKAIDAAVAARTEKDVERKDEEKAGQNEQVKKPAETQPKVKPQKQVLRPEEEDGKKPLKESAKPQKTEKPQGQIRSFAKGEQKQENSQLEKQVLVTPKTVEDKKQTPSQLTKPSYIKGVHTPVYTPPAHGQKGKANLSAGTATRSRTFDPNTRPGQKPGAGTPGGVRPPTRTGAISAGPGSLPVSKSKTFGPDKKKGEGTRVFDDKRGGMNKRTLIRKGFLPDFEERQGSRKLKNKKPKDIKAFAPIKIEKAFITTENLTVKILSEKIGVTSQDIIKKLMMLGIMTSINGVVDFPTMELVASEFGVEIELRLEKTKEEQLVEFHTTDEQSDIQMVTRPPIITVMGHVDHGKTSLLDAIRKTSVVSGEAGGITQHIGAYSVTVKGRSITFLDTPGHEAFTAMRQRGAQVTDIAVLVVAADDGVMPQTVEAINHANAAKVPIVVAINKIDKPAANVDKIKQILTEHGLVTEEWGGDTMMVPISAKQGAGIDGLLEKILLLADVNDYKANPARKAMGTIIEAKLDKGKGSVATIIVQNGTLNSGDTVVSGMVYGRIRAMHDDKGRALKSAGPSMAVQVQGLHGVPNAGDIIHVVEDERLAKQVAEERTSKQRNDLAVVGGKVTLDDMFSKMSESTLKVFNVIVKADVQGSAEAIKQSLVKLANEEVRLNVVHSGVGAINKSDMMLAEVSNATVIGFNVRPDAESKQIAESSKINIRSHSIIFEVIDEMTAIMTGMIEPKYKEVPIGKAEVRNVFKITGSGIVAGSYVLDGKIQRNCKVKVVRGENIAHEGTVTTLKRFKEDVKDVAAGYECGISVDGGFAVLANDILECYVLERIN